MVAYPGFVGPSYTLPARQSSCEECINLFPSLLDIEAAKNRYILLSTPGFRDYVSSVLSPIRCLFYQNGRMFGVLGYAFVEILSTGAISILGSVDSDGAPATISGSGDAGEELFVTSGGAGYIFNLLTSAFSVVVGLQVSVGGYLDGFFLALDTVNGTFRISDYLDGLTWDPLQFRVRGLASDRWTGMLVVQSVIFLFGDQTYEVWQNNGGAPFPFGPIPGYFFSQGLGARFSVSRLGDFPAWLSLNDQGSGQVLLAEQYAPTRISTHALESEIQGFLKSGISLSDAVAFSYQEDGHAFYCLTFPGADVAWVFDATTRLWHKRLIWVNDGETPAHFEAWRPLYHAFAFGKHLVGDRTAGRIYEMGTHLYSDVDDTPLRRVRRAPILYSGGDRVFIPEFRLDMPVGIGLNSGQGVNPLVMMRMSRNGGKSWGSERTRSAGAMGKNDTFVRWNKCGQARSPVVEVSVSDPVPWTFVNAYLPGLKVMSR